MKSNPVKLKQSGGKLNAKGKPVGTTVRPGQAMQ